MFQLSPTLPQRTFTKWQRIPPALYSQRSGLCTCAALPREERKKQQRYPFWLIPRGGGFPQLLPWNRRGKIEVPFGGLGSGLCVIKFFLKISCCNTSLWYSIIVIHVYCRKFGKSKNMQRIKQSPQSKYPDSKLLIYLHIYFPSIFMPWNSIIHRQPIFIGYLKHVLCRY